MKPCILQRRSPRFSCKVLNAKFVGVFGAVMVSSVERVNLFVCSLGTYEGSVVSFGALGCVVAW